MRLCIVFSGDEAVASTASVGSKSKSRKDTLAALAAARKKSGSTSSRKRKERRTKRSGGKEWRKTVNDIAPEGSNENHRFVLILEKSQIFDE